MGDSYRPGEEFLLFGEAGGPSQDFADPETLPPDVTDQSLGRNACRGYRVVLASGRVDVDVSRVPAVSGGFDPPVQLDVDPTALPLVNWDRKGDRFVFRAASRHDLVDPRRQTHRLARGTVDVILEVHVRRQSPLLVGVDAPLGIADRE